MASTLTPPSDPQNFIIKGDLDILNALNADMGNGTTYIRNGGLYVEGLTDLDQTTINTTDGKFHVVGTNKVEFDVSGGSTSAIEFTAEDASFFKTTAGLLTVESTATDSNGKILIQAAGTGTDSIKLNATNATSGQITIESAGGSTSGNAIRILATDTTDGDILIRGAGNMASSNPAVLIEATNTTSGQIRLTSAGASTSIDAVQILATNSTDGNILIQGSGNFAASNPAIKLLADNSTSGQILLESAGDSTGSDAIKLLASGSTGGNVLISAAGSNDPAVTVEATSSSGQVIVQSAGEESSVDSIQIKTTGTASGTSEGNILIQATGSFTSSVPAIKLDATNTSSGQVLIQSAGDSTGSDAIKLLASGSTGGNVLISAAGSNDPAVTVEATSSSGQVILQSAGEESSVDSIQIKTTGTASGTSEGNILIQATGSFTSSVPAIKLDATNTSSGQIRLSSAGDAAGSDAIRLEATGTTGGNVAIVAAGSTDPAVLIDATSSSGQVLVQSSGDESAVDSIKLLASATTDGNVLIQGNGANTNAPAIKLFADNDTSGQIVLESDGAINNAIRITADNGGIDIDAVGDITIDTTDTTDGVKIATATSGVPVTIGTSTSLTTVVGDLIVQGTTTTINTETLNVEDNLILLNSGNGELDIDAGLVIRRYQTPNNSGTGNVVNSPNPVQEQGAFQAGSSTPGTLVLGAHASDTDDFYNGWWIKITSGAGNNQVRRIKDYVGSTKTATIYVTADNTNTPPNPAFTDGLDLTTAPSASDTYRLYSSAFVTSYADESEDSWNLGSLALIPDPISGSGASIANIQQYYNTHVGEVDVHSKVYRNVSGSASTTTITFTIIGHGQSVGDKIYVEDSADFTPSITTGTYIVQTVPNANTFTITVASSTTSNSASSATITLMNYSKIKVNVIEPHDSAYGGIEIPGLACSEDIIIPKTSTSQFDITTCTTTYGSYLILVSDLNNTDGAHSVFAASSSGTGGSINRLSTSKGADNQRIDATWGSGQKVRIFQSPQGAGAGNYTYRVRVFSSL
ncbi:MAG TPA: hypothetical protein V6C58_14160 [Allocoleopsis sp.]